MGLPTGHIRPTMGGVPLLVCALLFACSLWAQKPIPFTYVHSLIFVEAGIGNSKPVYSFLVNTGSNLSVLDRKLAQSLGIEVEETLDSVMGTAGKEPFARTRIPALILGDQRFEGLEFGCRDLDHLLEYPELKVDGVLGTDFLRQFAIDLDFTKYRIRMRREAPPSQSADKLPFRMVAGLPQIRVRINDTLETDLRYNSASSLEKSNRQYLNLSHYQWVELKRRQRFLPHTTHFAAKGVGGYLYLQVVRLESMEAGALKLPYPYAIIQDKEGCFADPESIGFFGNSVLEAYRRVTLDFLHEEIILRAPAF